MSDYIPDVNAVVEEWVSNRSELVTLLIGLSDEIQKHEENTRIATLTGSSVSVVGTVVTVASLVAAFFTAGAALPIAGIAGAVTAGMGGATAGGASCVNLILRTKRARLIDTALRKDDEKVNEVNELIQRIEKEKSVSLCKKACHISEIVIPTGGGIYSTVKGSVQLADTSIINGAESAFATLSTASQVLHGFGFALSGVSLAFDIYAIVTTSIAVHKGKVLPVVEEIRKIAHKLNQDKLLQEPAIRQKIKILEE